MKKLYECIVIKDKEENSSLVFNQELLEDSPESAYVTIIRSLSNEDAENMKNLRIYIKCLTENEFIHCNLSLGTNLTYNCSNGILTSSVLKV